MTEKITPEQKRMLNAICGCLADQIMWHSWKLSKDDWRHLCAATALRQRPVPGISVNGEPAGLIYLSRSSLELTKEQASDAITIALQIGDHPDEQGLNCKPVTWSRAVLMGMGMPSDELTDFYGDRNEH